MIEKLINIEKHPIYLKKRIVLKKREINFYLGIPLRTIQLYVDLGLIIPGVKNPSGKGRPKLYSNINYHQFEVILELKSAGVPLKVIKGYLDKYRNNTKELMLKSRKVIRWQKRINDIKI